MALFTLKALTFTYPEQDTPALHEISFSLQPGEFAVLAGPSGCGKSTLLRQLKSVLAPHGKQEGEVLYLGTPLHQVSSRTQAEKIGFVLQDPDSQIVTDKVWHELAFGLESLGLDNTAIRGRVAEMASFFGIQNWFHMAVDQLSGGQKQLLNLASVMVLQPDLLILDEPTSQLDPIAATDFLQTLGRINRELGTTILLCEHRLEDVLPLASRLLILDGGRLLADAPPAEAFARLRAVEHPMLASMPTPMRIWSALHWPDPCPLTVSDGRAALTEFSRTHPLQPVVPRPEQPHTQPPCLTLSEVWFRYEKDAPDVLRGVTLSAYPGELLCILGGNGTGKSTTLSVLAGLRRPYRGKITRSCTRLAALPQNPQMLLVKKTVREELLSALPDVPVEAAQQKVSDMVRLCRLEGLLDRHPYDLSGGEQQRAALAKVLLQEPEVLLLDEPTKGVDNDFKNSFARLLHRLTARGVCIIMVSHDVEFCAAWADRCALFFDGSIVTTDAPQPFFAGKSFYTTAANRMARQLLPGAVTPEDVIVSCGGVLPPPPEEPEEPPVDLTPPPERRVQRLPLWRKLLGGLSGLGAFALLFYATVVLDFSDLYRQAHFLEKNLLLYGVMFALFAVFALCFSRRAPVREQRLLQGRLSRRTRLALFLSLLAIPLTIFLGLRFGGGRRYMLLSLAIVIETMLPFFLAFEGRRPQARELVLLSVLCALAICGRAVFFALPGFKPVAAMVILTGVAFGAESGFMVGAMTMLCSNILFGQGPWTPWQMFAMGLLGLLAGVLFRKGLLHRERLSLSIFGGLSVFVLYGGIMNPASVLMYQAAPTWKMILTSYLTGVPADAVHALATVLFLWFLSEPMMEKLDRIKVKYGLMRQEG